MANVSQQSPAATVDRPEMMANLREIARWVKLSGTTEDREAFGFLEQRMRQYGYRTNVILHDAYISLPGSAQVLVDGKPVACITHSFSRPSPVGGFSGVPVYVGGGTAADFANADVRGRIVLIDGMAMPETAKRASDAGASGQLHISHDEHMHEMCISPIWGSPAISARNDLPKTVACTVANADGVAIRDALAAGNSPIVTLHAQVDTGWRITPLLECELVGPDGSDSPFVLMSGHYDTWYYGVMDNGSANAGMMEAARVLAQRRTDLKRSVRVCFWSGHSHGRYSGSTWYVDTHWDELDRRCVAHVNVDSLGGIGATSLENAAAMTELMHLAREAVEAHTNQTYKGKRKARNSDESFVGVGIPSMFGSISEQAHKDGRARNALGWWWHTAHDLIDKVDEANLVRDTRVLTQVVWRLASDTVVPLDHAATLEALTGELTAMHGRLKGRFEIDDLIDATKALRAVAQSIAGDRSSITKRSADAANAGLMAVSRALVPVDYSTGDRFKHEPALPVPNWTALQSMRDLAATAPASDEEKFATVDANRARTRIAFALRQARSGLEQARAALGT